MANNWVGVILILFVGGLSVSGLLFALKPDLVAGKGDPLVRSFVLGYSLTFLALLVTFMVGCYVTVTNVL